VGGKKSNESAVRATHAMRTAARGAGWEGGGKGATASPPSHAMPRDTVVRAGKG
jgi:hypothetical protein